MYGPLYVEVGVKCIVYGVWYLPHAILGFFRVQIWDLYILVYIGCMRMGSIVVCLCVRLAITSGSDVLLSFGLYRFASFCRRAFVRVVLNRPSGAWRRISLWFVGCWVISYVVVGSASRSGFIGGVENVVCLGCQPRVLF